MEKPGQEEGALRGKEWQLPSGQPLLPNTPQVIMFIYQLVSLGLLTRTKYLPVSQISSDLHSTSHFHYVQVP